MKSKAKEYSRVYVVQSERFGGWEDDPILGDFDSAPEAKHARNAHGTPAHRHMVKHRVIERTEIVIA